LQIVEAKIVNENGKLTQTRKVTPEEWSNLYRQKYKDLTGIAQVKKKKLPENFYSIPGRLKQMGIFFTRDLLSKLANRQYILISFLGAPLLALLVGYFTRYSKGNTYQFIDNDNLTAYLFMCVITSMFLGLIISSEEILKDRKILKRESFLNLSWFSYINSKIIMMFLISGIQTISFILVGNSILGIKGMTYQYWLVLFTTSCCANMIGLNLSSALNSVITIYILIPFIIIPQLLFSGVFVRYDKLHHNRSTTNEYVPLIGELMPARWSYEALAVEQFENNRYEKMLFPYDMKISRNDWFASYLIYILEKDLYACRKAKIQNDTIKNNYKKLNYYIGQMSDEAGFEVPASISTALREERLDSLAAEQVKYYLGRLSDLFKRRKREAMDSKDSLFRKIAINQADSDRLFNLKTDYYNKRLASFVLNDDDPTLNKSVEKSDIIIQKFEPGFMPPTAKNGRAHFCAPFKVLGNLRIGTFWFNIMVIWLVSLFFYLVLNFNILRKVISVFGNTNKRRSDSSFLIIKEISSW
jgi:ABC transport system ATP-binding/permease protein